MVSPPSASPLQSPQQLVDPPSQPSGLTTSLQAQEGSAAPEPPKVTLLIQAHQSLRPFLLQSKFMTCLLAPAAGRPVLCTLLSTDLNHNVHSKIKYQSSRTPPCTAVPAPSLTSHQSPGPTLDSGWFPGWPQQTLPLDKACSQLQCLC